jgi:hypothetical protein
LKQHIEKTGSKLHKAGVFGPPRRRAAEVIRCWWQEEQADARNIAEENLQDLTFMSETDVQEKNYLIVW